jgi:hypothetical protein
VPAAVSKVSIVVDDAPGRSVQHGLNQLKSALNQNGAELAETRSLDAASGEFVIVAGLCRGPGEAARLMNELKLDPLTQPESLLVRHVERGGKKILLVSGADDRGLMYALLDVADRVGWAVDPARPFSEVRDTREIPDVRDRAISIYTMHRATFEERFFDEAYCARYFDMLARHRFNSFVLIFGYENGGYFAPAYPYFFDVEGFPEVGVVGFTHEQQQRHLRALNRLIEMAHDRGLQVRVGLWDHIYRGGVQSGGVKDADANKPIQGVPTGLTAGNLMAYSRAALGKFLKRVPELDGVQFRMHNESGLKRGAEMYEFWKNIYQVIKDTRPELPFDARAKEFPDELIDLALEMGIHIRITTKYWAEQMGLPFHPTHINRQNQLDRRHGYADLLRYPQRYQMHWRLWNGGTTRVLLWGDPAFARRFAASTHLYDGDGFEVNEMLATKMEAQPHDLKPFDLLRPEYRYYDYEFERYWHFYQVFGRLSYNPETSPEVWQREFRRRFGPDAGPRVEAALHRASWILPRINASLFPYHRFPTTRGWVEKQRWEDLPAYSKIEASDTEQFLSFDEAARCRLEGIDSAKLHPEQNSRWFANTARDVLRAVHEAEQRIGSHRNKELDSTLVDLRILAHLAEYHSRRIHAGLSYALFSGSQDLSALDDAIAHERNAIKAWESIVEAAGDVYADDLRMGLRAVGLSGHWRDELAALRQGLSALEAQRREFQPKREESPRIAHVPVRKASPRSDIVLRATVWGPAPIRNVLVSWQTPGNGSDTLAMQPAGPYVFQVPVPRAKLVDGSTYTIKAVDDFGRTAVFPTGTNDSPIQLRAAVDFEPPTLSHTPVLRTAAGKPLRITAHVRDRSGVRWVRLRYRNVTQFEDYRTLEMHRTARQDEYEAIVPGEDIHSKWDFMYLFETMDTQGNGKMYPDFETDTPYVVVKLDRSG